MLPVARLALTLEGFGHLVSDLAVTMGEASTAIPPCRWRLRWSLSVGQFGGLDKLGSGCHRAANFSVRVALYASSGVRPASIECGRRVL
jgi:hypothetical protein